MGNLYLTQFCYEGKTALNINSFEKGVGGCVKIYLAFLTNEETLFSKNYPDCELSFLPK